MQHEIQCIAVGMKGLNYPSRTLYPFMHKLGFAYDRWIYWIINIMNMSRMEYIFNLNAKIRLWLRWKSKDDEAKERERTSERKESKSWLLSNSCCILKRSYSVLLCYVSVDVYCEYLSTFNFLQFTLQHIVIQYHRYTGYTTYTIWISVMMTIWLLCVCAAWQWQENICTFNI